MLSSPSRPCKASTRFGGDNPKRRSSRLSNSSEIGFVPFSPLGKGYPNDQPLSGTEGGDMRVGILGSGLMGGKLGTIFARAGHEVVFSYARSEQKLKKLARDAQGKAQAGTPREVVQEADAVLLAVHWSRIGEHAP
jgi:hypothetical protein